MNLYGLTDIGAVRKDNQDSYAIRMLDDQTAVAVVCDGMGGAQAGNVASAVAVEAFTALVEDAGRQGFPDQPDARKALLTDAAQKANAQVYRLSETAQEFHGMGTTLVGAVILPDEIDVVNVGDSRCYLLDDGSIRQITSDHSLVQVLVDRGEITPEEARTHPKRNLITQALGVTAILEEDVYQIPRPEHGWLLLCSDGLTNVLTDDQIMREVCAVREPELCCRRLLDMTLEYGAPDNLTVVLAQL